MSELIDISLLLDENSVVRQIQTHSETLSAALREGLSKWVGLPLDELPQVERSNGT